MPSIADFCVARRSLYRKGNERNGASNGNRSYGMHGGRRVPLARFHGELNVKLPTFALERFTTRHVFGAFGGRIDRDLAHFTLRPHNAFSGSEVSCLSAISFLFSCQVFVQSMILRAPKSGRGRY